MEDIVFLFIGLVVAVLLAAYLLATLLHPERF